jgi:hypothetical protein
MNEEPGKPDDSTQLVIGVGPGAWDDVPQIHLAGRIVRAAFLPGGTVKGAPTVEILVELPDGRLIHANTTWKLWEAATDVFRRFDADGGLMS